MNRKRALALILCGGLALAGAAVLAIALGLVPEREPGIPPGAARAFAGSVSCRECHAKFYELWATSHHGLALQPFTLALAGARLTPQEHDIVIGERRYRADIAGAVGWVIETGPEGRRRYRMDHALGGKNVYYFLTPLEKGRLQVLPVAYDVRRKSWIDTAASMVRHVADRPVSWRDPLLTFNTACYSCHVSQLDTNYDLATDTYRTTWREPGISCETCHGPGAEHVRVCGAAAPGEPPDDLKILRYGDLDVEQQNATCAPCHARAEPLTASFRPGDRFFDHFDLEGFEQPDFHPDGRDLGENYTYTLWLTSPCVRSGRLGCTHCHTSSGRYRFASENPNGACLPCHAERVENAAAHHRHPEDSPAGRCVACHMPRTFFARMARSDHSMRPPTPAATTAFGSPNACNGCHTDRDARWADRIVRTWHARDYQKPVLEQAALIAAARKRDWTRLDAMLDGIVSPDHDPVVAASMIRLVRACPETRTRDALEQALGDPSPLVRGAAAEALGDRLTPRVVKALLGATGDPCRLVRIRAAGALDAVPLTRFTGAERAQLERAVNERLAAFTRRSDQWTSHYNLGNHHWNRGELKKALAGYELATRFRPDVVPPLVNAAMAHARLGQNDAAEASLQKALALEPTHAAVNLNLGLLLAEQGKTTEAERALRRALESDADLAQAAYNLGLLLARDSRAGFLDLLRRAAALEPANAHYTYTLAFHLVEQGHMDEARRVLETALDRMPDHPDNCRLLGKIHEQQGRREAARRVYERARDNPDLPTHIRREFQARARTLDGR